MAILSVVLFIFASLTQHSNGDAYDRTGCVFVIPAKDTVTFLDALEKGIKVLPVYKDNDDNEYPFALYQHRAWRLGWRR